MLPSEELQLQAHGYRKCYFAEMYCKNCGSLRTITEEPPASRHPCPICHEMRSCSGAMAQGYTHRPLPFHEQVSGCLPQHYMERSFARWRERQRKRAKMAAG